MGKTFFTEAFIRSANKHLNNVILSNAKNLVLAYHYEILHRGCPELRYETPRFTQGDKAKGSG